MNSKRLVAFSWAMMFSLILPTVTQSQLQADARESKEEKQSAAMAAAANQKYSPAPCISWINPLVKPTVALLCIHGLGLYSGAYQSFGMRMARRGIATYAIDVRGFGSWMKSKGHEDVDFPACLNDIKVALQSIRQAHPGLPVFLLGESMGGAIALRAASMYPELIEGLISSVPAGERFAQKKTDLKVAMQFLKGRHKNFDMGTKIVNQATSNEKLRADWADNPLDRMDFSPSDLIQFQKFMNENHDAAKNVTDDPVMFVQGTEDRLVKPEGTWDLFNELTTKDKYFLAVPSEHLIFEEGQDKNVTYDARVSNMVANWIFTLTHKNKMTQESADEAVAQDAAQPRNPATLLSPAVSEAVQKIVQGQYRQALSELQAAEAAHPDDAETHYWLGMDYAKLRQPAMARAEMMKALTHGKGSLHSQQANTFLLANSNDDNADPKTHSSTQSAAAVDPIIRGLSGGRPTVVAFATSWCDQCEPIDDFFKQAKGMFGDKIALIKIDVEEPTSDGLVKAMKVGPVPTFVFIDRTGRVDSTTIGKSSFINFAKGISGIIQ